MRRGWNTLRGWAACCVAVLLPYRARLTLFGAVDGLVHPSRLSRTRFFRWHMRMWNNLLLGLAFVLGLLPSRLFFFFWGRSRLAPPRGASSYWVQRQSPEELADHIEDAF